MTAPTTINTLERDPCIIYDLDGVICDFTTAYATAVDQPYAAEEWAFYKAWGWTHTQFHWGYVDHCEEILTTAGVIGGASRWRNHFRDVLSAGVQPIILTHRTLGGDVSDEDIDDYTFQWLADVGLADLCSLYNVGTAHRQSEIAKTAWVYHEGTHRTILGAVEDNVSNLAAMMSTGKIPLGIVQAQPYNQTDATFPEDPTWNQYRVFRMSVTGVRETLSVVAHHDIFNPPPH